MAPSPSSLLPPLARVTTSEIQYPSTFPLRQSSLRGLVKFSLSPPLEEPVSTLLMEPSPSVQPMGPTLSDPLELAPSSTSPSQAEKSPELSSPKAVSTTKRATRSHSTRPLPSDLQPAQAWSSPSTPSTRTPAAPAPTSPSPRTSQRSTDQPISRTSPTYLSATHNGKDKDYGIQGAYGPLFLCLSATISTSSE